MKPLGNLVAACLTATLLAACGGSDNGASSALGASSATSMSLAPQIAAPLSARTGSAALSATNANLYVADVGNATVAVYAPDSGSVLRTISQGLNSPRSLAFDGSGNLYVGNSGNFSSGPYDVTVYAPGSTPVLRTISQGVYSPAALAFDGSGRPLRRKPQFKHRW